MVSDHTVELGILRAKVRKNSGYWRWNDLLDLKGWSHFESLARTTWHSCISGRLCAALVEDILVYAENTHLLLQKRWWITMNQFSSCSCCVWPLSDRVSKPSSTLSSDGISRDMDDSGLSREARWCWKWNWLIKGVRSGCIGENSCDGISGCVDEIAGRDALSWSSSVWVVVVVVVVVVVLFK